MWGVALGPLTGQLLADAIATGTAPAELAAAASRCADVLRARARLPGAVTASKGVTDEHRAGDRRG